MVNRIYLSELQLNKANVSDTEASFLDLHLSMSEEKGQMRVKMSKPSPPAPTASAIGPCPTVIKIVGRPDTGS